MFNIGSGELLVIGLIALIVLGPDKLPQAARQLGRFTSEARKIANGFRQEMHDAMNEVADTPESADDRVPDRRLDAAPTDVEPIDGLPAEARPLIPPDDRSVAAPSSHDDWPPADTSEAPSPNAVSPDGTDPLGSPASGADDQARS